MPKKITTKDFIDKAIAKHGDKYDYSCVEYKGANLKVKIICKTHGEFKQIPSGHIRGNGCPICRYSNRKLTNDIFINKAISVHGDRYDYSSVEYETHKVKIDIICKFHGAFKQSPTSHLSGNGCSLCGDALQRLHSGRSRSTTEEFIIKSQCVHGDRYNYSIVEYKSAHKKIKIICMAHGVFEQSAHHHLKMNGCPSCASTTKSTTKDFVSKAVAVHGNKYDYSITEYKLSSKKVKIICKIHGLFEQTPSCHLSGQGCSGCANHGFDPSKPGVMYYIKFDSDTEFPLYKIGIANDNDVIKRIKSMKVDKMFNPTILVIMPFEIGADAYKLEQLLHKEYAKHKYYGDPIMKNGNTELFVKDVMGYDSIIKNN